MAMFDQTIATDLLALLLNDTAFSAVAATYIQLGSTIGTATGDQTQISGTGYTTGGSSITWNSVSSAATSNSNTISWTNGGSSWSIQGLEIWNTAGSVRYLFGQFSGTLPITVANGNTFQIAAAGVSVSLV